MDPHKSSLSDIPLLHPSILILTKFKRWSTTYTSTRPKTLRKVDTDRNDIRFMVDWLEERGTPINFAEYHGKTTHELLTMVRIYYDKYVDDQEHMERLRRIMEAHWEQMLALPVSQEENIVFIPVPQGDEHALAQPEDRSVLPTGESESVIVATGLLVVTDHDELLVASQSELVLLPTEGVSAPPLREDELVTVLARNEPVPVPHVTVPTFHEDELAGPS